VRWTHLLTDASTRMAVVNALAAAALILAEVALVIGAGSWLLGSTQDEETTR
jgi:type IV secretory pathway TrbD component